MADSRRQLNGIHAPGPVRLYTKQTSIERRSNAAQDNVSILRTHRFCVGRARALTAPSWFPLQLAGFAAGILLTRRSISKRHKQFLFQYHFRAIRLCMNAAPPRAAKATRGCAALLQKTTGPVGHSSVRTRWPYVAVVVVKRQKHNEGPLSRDDRGFVLVCVFLGFLAEGEPLALPRAKHKVSNIDIYVRYH